MKRLWILALLIGGLVAARGDGMAAVTQDDGIDRGLLRQLGRKGAGFLSRAGSCQKFQSDRPDREELMQLLSELRRKLARRLKRRRDIVKRFRDSVGEGGGDRFNRFIENFKDSRPHRGDRRPGRGQLRSGWSRQGPDGQRQGLGGAGGLLRDLCGGGFPRSRRGR